MKKRMEGREGGREGGRDLPMAHQKESQVNVSSFNEA
jgi:hypothetical protein